MSEITTNHNNGDEVTIGFIDPSELIGFEPDLTLKQSVSTTQSDRQESWDRIVTERSQTLNKEDLEYTKLLKEYAASYNSMKQEDVRGRLALVYTIATFLIFFVGFVVCILDGLVRHVSIIDNLKDVFPLLSGLFLGSLGFVLGYYFKKGEENSSN